MKSSALARALVALLSLCLPAVASAQFSVVRTSAPIFYNDVSNSPSLRGMYAAYEITNTSGSTYGDVWVDVNGFTGGVVGLAPSEDGIQQLGVMAPGQKKMAFFYLFANSTANTAQGHQLHVYASRPPAAAVVTQSFSLSAVESTIDANANKVNTVVTGPTPPTLGGIVTLTVSGETGTIGGLGVLAFTPAAAITWPADTYEMVDCTITLSGSANAGVLTDSLYWIAPSASATNYVAIYHFRAVNTTVAPTIVTPIGYFSSGANIKHTDTGGFGGFAPVPPAQNVSSLDKFASEDSLTNGAPVTYTVRVTNSGGLAIDLSDIVDLLPPNVTYVPGSTTFNGFAHADPSQVGQTLSWGGLFNIPANSSRDLVYQTNLPSITGTYTNHAYGHIGPVVIDSTIAVGDSIPAQTTIDMDIYEADVSVEKSATPEPVTLGTPLTYRLVITNAGPDSASGVVVTDTLPPSMTFGSVTTTSGSVVENGGVITATLGTMNAGQVDTVTILVTPAVMGAYSNTAHIEADPVDADPADNTSGVTSNVTAFPDLQMVKRSNGPFGVGVPASYDLAITNLGVGPSTQIISVLDTLPAGASFVGVTGAGWSASAAGPIVTATHPGPIAPGDSLVVTLHVALDQAAYPAIVNSAVAQTDGDSDPNNDRGRDSTAVLGAPELTVLKSHAGTFEVGSSGTYTIGVTNVGTASTSGDVTVVDTLAAGINYVSSSGTGWSIVAAPPIVTATYSALLAPSEGAQFTIDVTIDAAAIPQAINFAYGSTPGGFDGGNTVGRDTAIVAGDPDVQLVKRHGGDFSVGGTHDYAFTLTNIGTDVAGAMSVADTLPAGLSYAGASGANWSGSAAGQIVTLTHPGPLAAGDSSIVTLSVLVGAAAAPGVTNSALATVAGDVDSTNNYAVDPTNVLGAPDLALAKTHAPAVFAIGDSADYVLRVRNDGDLPTSGVIAIADTMPTGLGFGGYSGTGWTVVENLGVVDATHPGPLAPGDSLVLTLRVAVSAAAFPSVTNSAVATTSGDVGAGNDRAVDVATVGGSPDLQLVKRDVAAPFTVGAAAQYALTVTNVGFDATSSVISVVDTLATGLTYLGASGAGWSATESSGIVSATHAGPLAAGDSLVLVLDVRPGAAAAPSAVNAAVASTAGDTNAANDRSSVTTSVLDAPDLRIAKRHGADFVAGSNGDYTLVVYNEGTVPTAGTTTVLDTLPAGLSYVSASGAGWSISEALGIVTATTNAAIAPNDSASFTLTVLPAALAVPGVTNAAVASTPGDLDPSDDRAEDATVVLGALDVAVALRNDQTFVSLGVGSYTFTVTNVGSSPANGPIAVTDTMPTGLVFVSSSEKQRPNETNGVGWTINEAAGIVTATHPGPLAPGDSLNFQVVVAIGSGLGPTISNAVVLSVPNDSEPSNNRAVNVVTIVPAFDIALAKRHATDPVSIGSTVSYVLSATNVGDAPTSGAITVTDVLPAGLTYVGSSGAGWLVTPAGQTITAVYAGAVAPGDSAVLVLDVTADASALPSVVNSAVAATAGDPNAANDTANDLTNVVAAPDLALAKRHTAAFRVGVQGTYTLVATNVGASDATLVSVVDTLPAGLSYASASGSGWSFSESAGIVTATYGPNLAAGDSAQFDLVVDVAAGALGGVVNTAVASASGDVTPGNDRAVDSTSVGASPDLALTKRADAAFTVGTNGIYRFVVTNVGLVPTEGAITIVDTLAAGLTYTTFGGGGWTVGASGPVVTATHPGPIAAGDSLTLDLAVLVGAAAYPSVGNSAVASSPVDADSTNNRGTAPNVPVAISGDLALEKTVSPEEAEIAEGVTYTLLVRNLGVSPVTNVVVRDTLPLGIEYAAGTTFVGGSLVPDPSGGRGPALEFAVGTVPGNGAVTLTYRAMVQATALQGDGINRAVAESDALGLRSNAARAGVRVRAGAFTAEGIIAGKVFIDCDCDSNRVQGHRDLGVPGVRVYLSDGRSAITDVEGKYHFDAIRPRLHTVKVDATTLPPGARLSVVDTRDGLDAGSRFVDLHAGELGRADFVVAREEAVLADVLARRERGEVHASIENTAPAQGGGSGYTTLESVALDAANSNAPDAPDTPGLHRGFPRAEGADLELSVPRVGVPADGRTLVPLTVRVPGTGPQIVTLETDAGRFRVKDLDPSTDGIQTSVEREATFLLEAPERVADARVRVTLVDSLAMAPRGAETLPHAGAVERVADIAFVNAARPWIVAGVVEGRYEQRSLEDAELYPGERRDRFDDAFGTISESNDDGTGLFGGRGAVFAKGTVGNGALVTLRYDSEKQLDKLRFQDIRPDEGYPVFGDASIQGFETQSSDRAFARIEKDRSSVMWGDYHVGGTSLVRTLSVYDRTFNGGLAHLENSNASVDAFASHERDRRVVDEIPGRGISGPYGLSRSDGITNSEIIEIVTRDRQNPSVILTRRTLVRFADYTIEPFTGRLLLRQPVPSVDERLNPVSIRATYEVEESGDRFWTAGAQGSVRAGDRIELGGSYAKEDDPLEARTLFGGGAAVEVLRHTVLAGEAARTEREAGDDGSAWRGELRHRSSRLDVRGFVVRTDAGFDNPSAGFTANRDEWGGAGRYMLGAKSSVSAEGVRTRDRGTNGRRKGASLAFEHRFSKALRADLGYRWAREGEIPAGGPAPTVPVPNATDAVRGGLTAQLSRRTSAWLEIEKDVTTSGQERAALGADLRVIEHLRAYGRYEHITSLAGPYALNTEQKLNTAVLGLATDGLGDRVAFTEYRLRDAFAGRNAEAAIGLRNRWRVSRAVRLDGSFERVQSGDGDPAMSVTSGIEWIGSPLVKGTARAEYRTAQSADQWLASAGLAGKLSRDWTALVRTLWSGQPDREQMYSRNELALAFRETDRNQWNSLLRLSHRIDDAGDVIGGSRREALVLAGVANVHPSRTFTLTGQAAGKWSEDQGLGGTLRGQASLLSMRGMIDLSRRLDMAVTARTRLAGSLDRRNDGLGAELGYLVAKNLRVTAGYNAFGFHDKDFSGIDRTDHGPYAAIGFKFDEGLFGGNGGAGSVSATASDGAVPTDAELRAPAQADTTTRLAPLHERKSDERIARDLAAIDSWSARAKALHDSTGIYRRTKALGWLGLARVNYALGDTSQDAQRAYELGRGLVTLGENGAAALDSAAAIALERGVLPSSANAQTSDLWTRANALHDHPGFHCAEEEAARAEIAAAWAGVESRAGSPCLVPPHLTDAQRLADEAQKKAEECVKPVAPVVVPETLAVIPPPDELVSTLSKIPSGIHFAVNKHTLAPQSRDVVKRIAAALAQYPEVRVELTGHTDSRGSAEYNLALSKRRVDAVRDGLVAAGVDAARITTTYVGKEGLITGENNARELALNRRVDFKYWDKQGNAIDTRKQTEDVQVESAKP